MASAQGYEAGEPLNFHHPFTPYQVQLQFMQTAYDVLDRGNGQVGILESPTGTGKSLSLICAALTWLRKHKRSRFEAAVNDVRDDVKDEPAWLIAATLARKREELMWRWKEREERLEKIRLAEKASELRSAKRRRVDHPAGNGKLGDDDEDAEFLLDEVDTAAEMPPIVGSTAAPLPDEDAAPEDEVKIYYTSRTHSQLSQFIAELRRPSFPSSIPTNVSQKSSKPDANTPDHEAVRHIPLSSRQKLCINPSVARLGSLAAINDRCNELQQSKSKTRCSYIPRETNLSEQHAFRDAALATLPDIEDLHNLGQEHHICPYYASRSAMPGAEIVTLPYPLLLQRSAREALGIKLEGNVVIIDEAHNIMDAIAGVHAAEISLGDMKRARVMLGIYVKRFGKKLKGENRVLVAHVGKVIESLTHWMEGAVQSKAEQGIVEGNSLLAARGADQINLFRLIRYIQDSKLAFKVESYASHAEEQEPDSKAASASRSSSPVLHSLVAFLEALTNLGNEGRIFFERAAASATSPPDVRLKYLLLSPTNAFSSVASEARAIILAGGTMSPFDDYKAHLFPNHAPERITTLSCGHVIPASSLCVWTLASSKPSSGGPSADTFEFRFQKRSDPLMIRQLGVALLNICGVVPDGVVVFFPSYGYLDEVVKVWQSRDSSKPGELVLWERLATRKALFRETKGSSSDEVLAEYSAAILDGNTGASSRRGAVLLSVVGGKMSEGINFSDRLGRCVVIVGLPYPNINSPEWKARIEYLESSTMSRLLSTAAPDEAVSPPPPPAGKAVTREDVSHIAKQASREFYENACMRAVNQSIGRAIRHKGDYAAIVLVDRRFGTQRIRGKLPGWIRGGMVDGSESKGVPGMMGALNGFIRGRKGI